MELGILSAREKLQLLALKDLTRITRASSDLSRRNATESSKIGRSAVEAIIAAAAATQRLSAADLIQDPSMLHLAESLHRAISTYRAVLINEGAKHAIPEAVTVEPSRGRDSIIEAGLKVARIPPPLHELIKRNPEVQELSEKLYARALATLE